MNEGPTDGREVAVGVIRRPFGLRGEVFVHPDPDLDDEFSIGERFRAVPPTPNQEARELTVDGTMLHRGMRIVSFAGVDDRDSASLLRDFVLWREAYGEDLDAEAFWASDLLGLPVVDEHGAAVGEVTGLRDGPAHDYLVLTPAHGREVLIPAVAHLVTVETDRVVLRAMPGLLDLDQAEG
ncbi:MAG: 16S rRNA processing protein RimM [Nitriliruptorales bacterium]|nr:16S rRNA processing protein RimM [Nitriliruptorales bacterium]